MALEIEIKSNSKQAETSLKRILDTIDKLPMSANNADKQLKNSFKNSFSGLENTLNKNTTHIKKFSKGVGNDLGKLNKSVDQANVSIKNMTDGITTFANVTAGLFTGILAAGGITSVSSHFVELGNRIALVTGRTEALAASQTKLFAVARRSRSDLQTTVDLFSSLSINANLSNKDATALTETLIKAGKIGGGSMQTIQGSLVQLQQGLASGTLRGEELNSVLEGTPRIAQAIAKELKVGTGELRALAAEGRISAELVKRALLNAKDEIDGEFGLLRVSLSQAMSDAGRELGIGLNRVIGVLSSGGVTDFVISLTDSLREGFANLSVFLRVLQTDFLLFRLSLEGMFDGVADKALGAFKGLVGGVLHYTDKLFAVPGKIKDWAREIGDIFYDLYIEVVGNSTWPDLIDGVILTAKGISGATKFITGFTQSVGNAFARILNQWTNVDFADAMSSRSGIIGAAMQARMDIFKITSEMVAGTLSILEGISASGDVFGTFASTAGGHFVDLFSKIDFSKTFVIMIDKIVGYTEKLFAIPGRIRDWAKEVGSIFYDLYIEIVGNSTWPDLVDGVIAYASNIFSASSPIKAFAMEVRNIFAGLVSFIQDHFFATSAVAMLAAAGVFGAFAATLVDIAAKSIALYTALELLAGVGFFEYMADGFSKLADSITPDLGSAFYTKDGFIYAMNELAYRASILPGEVASYFDLLKDIVSEAASLVGDIVDDVQGIFKKALSLTIQVGIESLGTVLSTAFLIAFGTLASGALAGNLGAMIGAGIMGVLASASIGFTSNFDISSDNTLEKIYESQENLLFTVTDGIAEIVRTISSMVRYLGDGSGNDMLSGVSDAMDVIADNMAAFLLAIPAILTLLKAAGKTIANVGVLMAGGGATSAGNAAGDLAQRGASQTRVLALRARRSALEAEMEGLASVFKQNTPEYDRGMKSLRGQVTSVDTELSRLNSVFEESNNRIAARMTAMISAFTQFGVVLGGLIGGFAAAQFSEQLAKEWGLSAAESYTAIILGSQLGAILGSMIGGAILSYLSTKIAVVFASLAAQGGIFAVLSAKLAAIGPAIAAGFASAMAFMRGAIIAAHMAAALASNRIVQAGYLAGAAIIRGAHLTGILLAKAVVISGIVAGFLTGTAGVVIAIVAALAGIAYLFKEELMAALSDFGEYMSEAGSDLADAFMDGITGIGTWIADQVKAGLGFLGDLLPGNNNKGLQGTHDEFSGVGYATGGHVKGAGTGTSDSIPAMLSNGEYVINAKSTSGNLDLLRRINSGENWENIAKAHIRKEEGDVSRVYHDSRHLLTAGVGHLLSEAEAKKFSMDSGIGIKKHSSGLGWTAYPNEKGKYPNDTMLKSANHQIPGLDGFFEKDFAKHSKIAQNAFPNHWETFTSQMKTALVDHAFQLGGFSGWPGLVGEATSEEGPLYDAMIANYGSSLNASQTPNRVAARQELIRQAQMRRQEILGNKRSDASYLNGIRNSDFFSSLYSYLPGFNTGGFVSGDGTGTSDSIPAMLSNGEYVIKASAVKALGTDRLDLINQGRVPGFNTGGPAGATSKSGEVTGMFDQMLNFLADALEGIIGEEAFASLVAGFEKFKNFFSEMFSFGGGSETASDGIFDAAGLTAALSDTLTKSQLKIDQGELTKYLDENAQSAKRLLDLNNSRAKVQQKIADIQKRGEKVPFEIVNQLRLIDGDLVTELGTVTAAIEEGNDSLDKLSKFQQDLVDKSVGGVRQNVQGNISGFLKGEQSFSELGDNLLSGLGNQVIDTFAASFTEGLFQNGDSLSGIGSFFEGMFTTIGGAGESSGDIAGGAIEEGGGFLSSLFGGGKPDGTAANPLNVVSSGGFSSDALVGVGGGTPGMTDVVEGTEEVNQGFLSGLKSTFDGFFPGLSGIFDSLTGSLGGIFDGLLGSIGGLFGGGGGGGGGGSILGMLGGLAGFFNDGGLVPGGGPKPAIVHGGEMILNKRQQSHLFGELDRARNGQTGNQQQISINVTGDISRQTKKEIYSMMPTIAQGVNQQNKEQNR